MPGQNRPAGELDGSPLSDGGVNVRSSVGAARKYCGLCRNGSCGLKATMTNAPINTATPIATRDKKNLVTYSGGLSSLLFSQAMCDLIGRPRPAARARTSDIRMSAERSRQGQVRSGPASWELDTCGNVVARLG